MEADIVKVVLRKAVLGPCPRSKLMPSGGLGIAHEELSRRIKAGAAVPA